MTTETMTVHKALAELKTMDGRISKAVNSAVFVVANKHSNDKINGKSISEFKENIRSAHQKVLDLISRKNAMKRAVVLSNAKTTVVIGGETFTVAEAIEMKNHGMDNFESLLRYLESQYSSATYTLNQNSGENIERQAENYIRSVISSQPKDSKMAVDSKGIQTLREQYIENNTYDMIDPLDVAKRMEELSEYITNFNTEVDSALSVSNALTVVEFSY